MIGAGAKVAIGLGVAALAALGVAAGVAMAGPKPAGPALPPGTPPAAPGSSSWTPATQVAPGQRVRISVAAPDLAQIAQSLGASAGYQGWLDILANPIVQNALHAQSAQGGSVPFFLAWGPNPNGDGTMFPSVLPADWPPDDTAAATEYHAEFVYGGAQPLLISALPIPIRAWTQGPGSMAIRSQPFAGYGAPYVPPAQQPGPFAGYGAPYVPPAQPGGALPSGLPFIPPAIPVPPPPAPPPAPAPGPTPHPVTLYVGDTFAPPPPVNSAWSIPSSWDHSVLRQNADGSFTAIAPGATLVWFRQPAGAPFSQPDQLFAIAVMSGHPRP